MVLGRFQSFDRSLLVVLDCETADEAERGPAADARRRAAAFARAFGAHVTRLQSEPQAYGEIGLADLLEMREEALREFGFRDVYRCLTARISLMLQEGLFCSAVAERPAFTWCCVPAALEPPWAHNLETDGDAPCLRSGWISSGRTRRRWRCCPTCCGRWMRWRQPTAWPR